jgi:hypothetical protein
MKDLPLTEWIPCTAPPVRYGWYEVRRQLSDGRYLLWAERVGFGPFGWIWDNTDSKMPVWVSYDFWRGVAIDPEADKP